MNTAELRNPAEVEGDLDEVYRDLDQLGKDLDAAYAELDAAEAEWTHHYDDTVDELEEEAEGAKLPGEHALIREARRRGGWDAWRRWRKAEREIKRIEKRITQAGNLLTGNQTKLKQVRAENGGAW